MKIFPLIIFFIIVLTLLLVCAGLFIKSFLNVKAGFEFNAENNHNEELFPGAATGGPAADEGEIPAAGWKLVLVNPWNSLPQNWKTELVSFKGGEQVDKRIYGPLTEMLEEAASNGIHTKLVSGFRTKETQQNIMDKKVRDFINLGYTREESEYEARKWVAAPGTSEHQLGIAVDINGDYEKSTREEVYSWLENNCARFGFILRYPADKTEITGIAYEPWHFRYVGRQAAEEMNALGYCLEEYIEYLGLYENAEEKYSPAA